jgi:hypothetical protein
VLRQACLSLKTVFQLFQLGNKVSNFSPVTPSKKYLPRLSGKLQSQLSHEMAFQMNDNESHEDAMPGTVKEQLVSHSN